MMYPLMTLNDETEIVRSDMFDDGEVKVYIENFEEIIRSMGGFYE